MTAILTDEQIVTLLATDGGREEMLQEAARLGYEAGMLRASNRCEEEGMAKVNHWTAIGDNEMIDYAKSQAWDLLQAAHAIRAEVHATAASPPRS